MSAKPGTLFVVSGPSGVGKYTVLHALLERVDSVACAISATTRAPRDGERDGVDYFFIDEDEFSRRVASGDFVEWAEVHGHRYGTLRDELARLLDAGTNVILELDVQGMRAVERMCDRVVTIFITAPSLAEIERRLRDRGTNDEADIALRLRNAAVEMDARDLFDHVVLNGEVERAVSELAGIIRASECTAEKPA